MDRPTLAFPVSGENYVKYDAEFQIKNQVAGATSYVYEIDTVSTFNSPFKLKDSSASIIWTKNVMKYGFGKKYFWRVRAKNNSESSSWSDTWSFYVQNNVKLYSPSNGTFTTTISPYVQIETFGSVPEYLLEIDTISTFVSSFRSVRFPTSSTPYVQLWQMPYGKKIYWRCRATNGWGDTSEFSHVWYLQIPSAPDLINPSKGLTGADTQVNYSVKSIGGTTQTQVYIAEAEDFSNAVLYTGPSGKFRNLKFGTTYYWKARNLAGTSNISSWSNPFEFTTKYQLSTPVVTAPVANASISTDSVIISWLTVTPQPVSGYLIQIDTTSELSIPMEYFSATTQFKSADFFIGRNYYYRIRAFNDLGKGPWSTVRSFTYKGTSNAVVIQNSGSCILNHSGGVMLIPFSKDNIESLHVFNAKGQPVKSLSKGQELNLGIETDGVYFVTVILENGTVWKGKFLAFH